MLIVNSFKGLKPIVSDLGLDGDAVIVYNGLQAIIGPPTVLIHPICWADSPHEDRSRRAHGCLLLTKLGV